MKTASLKTTQARIVTLVSGGIDSSVVAALLKEQNVEQFPVFVNYGQLGCANEWKACKTVHRELGLREPHYMDMRGFGASVPSGITSASLRRNEDAFLPGRNTLFLLTASSYAYSLGISMVAIGLIDEDAHIFADQTRAFIDATERYISLSFGTRMSILTPLLEFTKAQVMALADIYDVANTYSCHDGKAKPCGHCVACKEITHAITGMRG